MQKKLSIFLKKNSDSPYLLAEGVERRDDHLVPEGLGDQHDVFAHDSAKGLK